ncbi:MAG TPA: DNA-formamidopyrimidine glycosylase family protein [Egibacteraceae bacterium]|nr:DNA-formamidopyrimidine glycosylase family protein [Egibacteraceae bacterium]
MPEGDTIHRSARALGRALRGGVVAAVAAGPTGPRSAAVQRLVGETVERIEARGKHLLVWFSPSGLALHTHMMMSGAWHLYRPGQSWLKPRRRATVVLEVPGWTAVCFSAPVCELLTGAEVARHPALAGLGPDANAERADLAVARARLDARPRWTIGEALLDQRVLAGVGNVYKCEVLFLHGVDPWCPVAAVTPVTRDALLVTAERLLKANAASADAARSTTGGRGPGARLHVYGRARRPCRRCGTAVRVARQGPQARLTFWCPRCQPPVGGGELPERRPTRR